MIRQYRLTDRMTGVSLVQDDCHLCEAERIEAREIRRVALNSQDVIHTPYGEVCWL